MSPKQLLPLFFLFACSKDVIDHRGQGVTGRPTNPGEIGLLAQALNHPLSFAVDDSGAYVTTGWIDNCLDDCPFLDGELVKADFNGNVSTLHFAGEQLLTPVIDGATLYFTSPDSGNVYSMPKGGGNVNTLATSLREPMMLAVDGNVLTWINCGSCGFAWGPTGELARMAITSTAPTIIPTTDGFVGGMAIAGNETIITRVIYDRTMIERTELVAIDSTTGAERIILNDLQGAGQVFIDGNDIYFVDTSNVRQTTLAGSVSLNISVPNMVEMAIDQTHIYVSVHPGPNSANGFIGRFAKGSPTIEKLVDTDAAPGAIAVDDDYVYWIEAGRPDRVEGHLHAILKP